MSNYSRRMAEGQELCDVRKSDGKQRPWKEKKDANETYADLLSLLNYNKTQRVSECAEVLRFQITECGYLKLSRTWFCKSRLCPMCAWRRSIKHGLDIQQVVEEAQERYPSGRWVFVTLTTKNTSNARELRDEITRYSPALARMMKRKVLKKYVLGYVRGIEVTVNKDDNTYNQHMHVLLFVKSTYFSQGYMSQEKWIDLWQEVMGLDYKPSVRVSAIKKGDKDNFTSAILEISKYTVKSFDYVGKNDSDDFNLAENMKIVDDLEKALAHKRLTAYVGVLKEISKEMSIENVESKDVDLIKVGDGDDDDPVTDETLIARWDRFARNYYIKRKNKE